MSNHITINGQTFASVEEMPPELRREYDLAMQMLARNSGGPGGKQDGDVSISTESSDPAHHSVKTVARMTTQRIIVNGREYHDLSDVPAAARAALHEAGLGAAAPRSVAPGSGPIGTSRTPARGSLQDLTLDSSTTITIRPSTLVILILCGLLAGLVVGFVAGMFTGGTYLH